MKRQQKTEQESRNESADKFDLSEDASERKVLDATRDSRWAESDDFGSAGRTDRPDDDLAENRVSTSLDDE